MAASPNLFDTQVLRVFIIAAKQLARAFAQRQVSSTRVNVQVYSLLDLLHFKKSHAASLHRAFHWPLPLPTPQRRQALMKLKETQEMHRLVRCVCALESRCKPRGYPWAATRLRPQTSFTICCTRQYMPISHAIAGSLHALRPRVLLAVYCWCALLRNQNENLFHAHLQSS
jgi:hypothetical protein